jgi:PEP-CTERM motif
MKDLFRLGTLCVAATLFAGLCHAGAITTYTFAVDCCDDSYGPGSGTGTLVLQNYTLGAPLETSNFVSFSYLSDWFSISTDSLDSTNGSLAGMLPVDLPGPANVSIGEMLVTPGCPTCGEVGFSSATVNNDVFFFQEVGSGFEPDFGTDAIWSAAAQTTATPEPSSLVMLAAGLAGLVAGRQRIPLNKVRRSGSQG